MEPESQAVVNTSFAWLLGASLPAWFTAGAATAVGLAGYGLSLALFVRALLDLGTARTGAYFPQRLSSARPSPSCYWANRRLRRSGWQPDS